MNKKIIGAAGFVTAGILAGSIMAMSATANAATVDTATTSVTSTASNSSTATTRDSNASSSTATSGTATAAPTFGNGGPGGADAPDQFSATSVRSDETTVTGTDADKLKAAAEAKVSGATAFRIETDGDGSAYEVHMKKADGSVTTVKFDKNFNVTSVEDGFGAGGPAGNGGPAGAPGNAPQQSSASNG